MRGEAAAAAVLLLVVSGAAQGHARAPEARWGDGDWPDPETYLSEIERLAGGYPLLARAWTIGWSHEDRPLTAVRLSDHPEEDEAEEPELLVLGAIHGNEPASAALTLEVVRSILAEVAWNASLARLIERTQIVVVGMVNPDGVAAGTRKNARPNGDGSVGVDLNRNFGKMWGTDDGTSDEPSSTVYHGPEPFSEPESQAVRDLAEATRPNVSISYHTYGSQVFYPWGWTTDPPDDPGLVYLASGIASINGYVWGQASDPELGGYLARGDSQDWLYANLSCLALTVELGASHDPGEAEFAAMVRAEREAWLWTLRTLDGMDADGDGAPIWSDPFPDDGGEWSDADGDGIGDNRDPDDDNDGVTDPLERAHGTDPHNGGAYPTGTLEVAAPAGETAVVTATLVGGPGVPEIRVCFGPGEVLFHSLPMGEWRLEIVVGNRSLTTYATLTDGVTRVEVPGASDRWLDPVFLRGRLVAGRVALAEARSLDGTVLRTEVEPGPFSLGPLTPGVIELSVYAEGYLPWHRTVVAFGDLSLEVSLAPRPDPPCPPPPSAWGVRWDDEGLLILLGPTVPNASVLVPWSKIVRSQGMVLVEEAAAGMLWALPAGGVLQIDTGGEPLIAALSPRPGRLLVAIGEGAWSLRPSTMAGVRVEDSTGLVWKGPGRPLSGIDGTIEVTVRCDGGALSLTYTAPSRSVNPSPLPSFLLILLVTILGAAIGRRCKVGRSRRSP